jgi:hypothetical protein
MYFGVLLLIVLIAGRGHAAAVFAHFLVRTVPLVNPRRYF